MRFVFVMDPIERVNPEKDTSFGFIEAAVGRGHRCDHALIHAVEYLGGSVTALSRRLGVSPRGLHFEGEAERVRLDEVDAVFVRKDPPFDEAYGHATLLLELLRSRTLVINDPRGLREANEKLYALYFERWMPRTIVTSDAEAIHAFAAEVGGKAVIKPLDAMGGFGVLAVRTGDENARGIVDVITMEGTKLAMVQEYLPAVAQGDKRVLLLDGEPLGAIVRVPTRGDLRANIHVGGKVVAGDLTPTELEMIADLAPRLRADGLFFVGLDLIGEKLTEVNVTSPTGIRELSRFARTNKSDLVIAWVEKRLQG